MAGIWDRFKRTDDPELEPEVTPDPQPDTTPQPKYITAEELQSALDRAAQQQMAGLRELLTPQPQPQQQARRQFEIPPDITDEDLREAFEEGNLVKYDQLQKKRLVHREAKFNAQLNQLRDEGMQAIATINETVTTGSLPDIQRYKPEMDRILTTFDASVRTNPDVVKFVYNAVKGQHADKIAEEAVEAYKRQQAVQPTQESGDSTGRDKEASKKRKSWQDYFGGTQAEIALSAVGGDPDAFARKLGYKSMDDYITVIDEYDKKPTHKTRKR